MTCSLSWPKESSLPTICTSSSLCKQYNRRCWYSFANKQISEVLAMQGTGEDICDPGQGSPGLSDLVASAGPWVLSTLTLLQWRSCATDGPADAVTLLFHYLSLISACTRSGGAGDRCGPSPGPRFTISRSGKDNGDKRHLIKPDS